MYKLKITYIDYDGTVKAKILDADWSYVISQSNLTEYQVIRIEKVLDATDFNTENYSGE